MIRHHPSRTNGFSVIEVLLVLLIVGLVGGAGYLVWRAQAGDGNSGPARAAATGTGSDKAPTDPKTGWLRYTTPGGEYSMSLPDGWDLARFEKLPHLFGYTNDLGLRPGKPAKVTEDNSGRDGLTAGIFIVYDVPQNISDPHEGAEKTPSFYTDDGLLVEVHRYIEEVGGEGMGALHLGTREYTYRISQAANGHIVQVTYLCPSTGPDHYKVVESAVKTISIPK